MTSRLTLYNGALDILGEENLTTLTDDVPHRYKLDDIWDNGVIRYALQQGQWNFATRTVQLDASPSVTPSFGFRYAFDKPSDHVRTLAVCLDEHFRDPLEGYKDEANWWWADLETIYVAYVSDDEQYGFDFSIWPPNFQTYVEHLIAYRLAPKVAGITVDRRQLKDDMKDALRDARSTDAMEDPTATLPRGSWTRARRVGSAFGRDGGSTTRLIG